MIHEYHDTTNQTERGCFKGVVRRTEMVLFPKVVADVLHHFYVHGRSAVTTATVRLVMARWAADTYGMNGHATYQMRCYHRPRRRCEKGEDSHSRDKTPRPKFHLRLSSGNLSRCLAVSYMVRTTR
jgi:hypothetical protein